MGENETVDPGEVAKFEAQAAQWWDPKGPAAPLHAMNPCRLGYIVAQTRAQFGRQGGGVRPFEGLRVLDVGCGGGLLSEPMARLGASVTGLDPAGAALPVARAHAAAAGLEIDYRAERAGDLATAGARFDVVLAMEVIEHVPDQPGFLREVAGVVAEGGLMIVSTLNRTPAALAFGVIGAEYVLGLLPRGTHDWRRFVTPRALAGMLEDAGLEPVDRRGMVFDPLARDWRLSARDLSINYLMTAVR
ncbi:MAG: bifunctional 2-polyprenyl-6-hydroxyphenol methylase/3-demethylubiquinol 3-O-methyltransferase UbiG [Pseudomonadota bacterium]